MPRSWLRILGSVFLLSAASICIAASLFAVLSPVKLNTLFNSDLIHPQALVDDVLRHGGHLVDWTLPPNPSLFPDGLMFLAAWGVSANFRWTFVWYAVLSLLLMWACLHALIGRNNSEQDSGHELREARSEHSSPRLSDTSLLFSALLLPVLWEFSPLHSNSRLYMSVLLLPISHGSVFFVAILSWVLARKLLDTFRWDAACGLGVLLLCSTASDRVMQSVVVAPLLVVMSVEWRAGNSRAAPILLVGALSALAGEGVLRLIGELVPLGIVPPTLGDSWLIRVELAAFALGKDLIATPHVAVLAGIVTAWIVSKLRRPQAGSFGDAVSAQEGFFILAFLAAIGGPIVTGVYREGAMRYVTPGVALGLVGFLTAHCTVVRTIRPALLVGAIGLLAATILTGSFGAYFWYRPPVVRCLDLVAASFPTTVGVSDFWNANRISYLSTQRLTLLPLSTRARLFDFAVNRRRAKERFSDVSFAIMDRLPPAAVKKRFGKPTSVRQCGGATLWIFSRSSSEPAKSMAPG